MVSISAVILTHDFSNFADCRQLPIWNAQTKYYEVLTTYTEIPHNTMHNITNWYIVLRYHHSTLREKLRLILNKGLDRTQFWKIHQRSATWLHIQAYKATNVFYVFLTIIVQVFNCSECLWLCQKYLYWLPWQPQHQIKYHLNTQSC